MWSNFPRGKNSVFSGERFRWKMLSWQAAAAACAFLWATSTASAQVNAQLTGSVNANYGQSTDQNNNITYSFDGSSASLGIDDGVPIEMYVSANASTGGTQDWTDLNTWDGGGLLALQDAATLTSTVAGVVEGDWFSYIALPKDAFNTLVTTGPTEKSIGIPDLALQCSILPGVDVQLSASASLEYDVVLPTGSNVLMNQAGVVVQSLTLQSGATLTGNGGFTVRTDLLNEGTLYGVGGTAQGNFSNVTVGPLAAYSDITASTAVQGTFANTGTIDIESTGSLNLSQSSSNNGEIDLYGGSINALGTFTNTNTGTLNLTGGIFSTTGFTNFGRVTLLSGYFGGSGAIMNNGSFELAGGIIGVNGAGIFNNTSSDFSVTATSSIDGTTFNNAGSISHQGTAVVKLYGTTLNNLVGATYDLQGDGGFAQEFNGATQIINNAGLFEKSAGTGTSAIGTDVAFNNTGTVEIDAGTLTFAGYGSSTNGAFVFSNGSYLDVATAGEFAFSNVRASKNSQSNYGIVANKSSRSRAS